VPLATFYLFQWETGDGKTAIIMAALATLATYLLVLIKDSLPHAALIAVFGALVATIASICVCMLPPTNMKTITLIIIAVVAIGIINATLRDDKKQLGMTLKAVVFFYSWLQFTIVFWPLTGTVLNWW
jgi:uncharacterized membrane protein YoaK (UPF0700 family)